MSRIVPAKSHSSWQMPGSVGRMVVVVVVVVVVVGRVNGLSGCVGMRESISGLSEAALLKSDAKSSLTAPDCWRSFSMEIGVVATVGHPVNVALGKLRFKG